MYQGKIWYNNAWVIVTVLPAYKRAMISGEVFEMDDDNNVIIDSKAYRVYDLDTQKPNGG